MGRYRIGEELARGGMGAVHLAIDTVFDRVVALKIVQERFGHDPATLFRFEDEARITAQLQHPAIPPVFDLGVLPDGRPYLAMKLIRGQTLDSLLKARSHPLIDQGRYLGIFEQICQAVAFAHSNGVMHRDLKPANVMVGDYGEVQVMDWGLAKVLANEDEAVAGQTSDVINDTLSVTASNRTYVGSVLGTPAYMPPEQARANATDVGKHSDVFGLGRGARCDPHGQAAFQCIRRRLGSTRGGGRGIDRVLFAFEPLWRDTRLDRPVPAMLGACS